MHVKPIVSSVLWTWKDDFVGDDGTTQFNEIGIMQSYSICCLGYHVVTSLSPCFFLLGKVAEHATFSCSDQTKFPKYSSMRFCRIPSWELLWWQAKHLQECTLAIATMSIKMHIGLGYKSIKIKINTYNTIVLLSRKYQKGVTWAFHKTCVFLANLPN